MGTPTSPSPADLTAGIAFAARIFEEIEGDEFESFENTFADWCEATPGAQDRYAHKEETASWLLAATVLEQQQRIALLERLLGEALGVMSRGHDRLWGIDAPTVADRIRAELAGKESR